MNSLLNMRILGNCGQCGKPIGESKKTCGATYAVCRRCKVLLHPHCLGEHRLMHNNKDYYLKHIHRQENLSPISKLISFIRNKFSGSNISE